MKCKRSIAEEIKKIDFFYSPSLTPYSFCLPVFQPTYPLISRRYDHWRTQVEGGLRAAPPPIAKFKKI